MARRAGPNWAPPGKRKPIARSHGTISVSSSMTRASRSPSGPRCSRKMGSRSLCGTGESLGAERSRPAGSQTAHRPLLANSGMIPVLRSSSGMGLELCRIASMRVVTTREASELTGISTAKLREWTSRRALIPADVRPKSQGSPAKYTWQTILLLRIAVILRNRFHLELQAHRNIFANLRRELRGISFVMLWGKSLAIHDGGYWSLRDPMDSVPPEGDMLLIKLDPHLQVLSVSFALPNPSSIPSQLDLFPARAVSGKAAEEQEAGLTVERSVHETAQRRRSA